MEKLKIFGQYSDLLEPHRYLGRRFLQGKVLNQLGLRDKRGTCLIQTWVSRWILWADEKERKDFRKYLPATTTTALFMSLRAHIVWMHNTSEQANCCLQLHSSLKLCRVSRSPLQCRRCISPETQPAFSSQQIIFISTHQEDLPFFKMLSSLSNWISTLVHFKFFFSPKSQPIG